MPTPAYTTTCVEKRLIAPGVYELRLGKPLAFHFIPGQFVLFDVPLPGNPDDIQPRAYSIASAPSEPDLRFVIKLVPGGRASIWLEKHLEQGAALTFKGPFGVFTLDRETKKSYLFIALGTGVAPFRSQMKWLLEEEGDRRPLRLLFGLPKQEDLFWEEEFRELERKNSNCTVHLSFLSGEEDWRGGRGSVKERIPQVIQDFSNVSIYLCGAPDTVQDLKHLCLSTFGVPKEDVHTEAYI